MRCSCQYRSSWKAETRRGVNSSYKFVSKEVTSPLGWMYECPSLSQGSLENLIDIDVKDFFSMKRGCRNNGSRAGKIWEPLPHHTVVHNVTQARPGQARPGWSVAPTSLQGRKQIACLSVLLIFHLTR